MAYPLLQPLVKLLLNRIFKIRLIVEGYLPTGNYIISSNHHSWLDPILLTLLWPAKIDMMYIGPRDTVLNTFWKRWIIGGMHRVALTAQRSGWIGKEAYQMILHGLIAGRCLLIFPEGDAYPREGTMMPFYPGVAYFALKRELPVVPVGLCGTADLYYRKQIIAHIGKAIYFQRPLQPSKKLVENALVQIQESTQRLIEGYQDPEVSSKPMHWLTHLM